MTFPTQNRKTYIFLLIILCNIVFFSLAAYILPIRYYLNDDVAMCLYANGIYTGTPEARLIFINVIYGLVLKVFYNLFPAIEWYALFFSVIHVISLSIAAYFFIMSNKARPIKVVSIALLYVLELTIVQQFQFTTTAAIAGFAGILLLLERKRVFIVLGMVLFLVGALVRFQAAMLVMLLLIPVFVYKIFPDWKINIKRLLPAAVCICAAFLTQLIDSQAYKSGEWSYYTEYNKVRGQINDNPNSWKINLNELPEGISLTDYYLLQMFLPDGKYINLTKMQEIKGLIEDTKIVERLKNIWPSLNQYRIELIFIIVLLILSFIINIKKSRRIFISFCLIFYIMILSIISLNGLLKPHVFISTLFPVLFIIYYNINVPSVNNSSNKAQTTYQISIGIFTVAALFLSLNLLNNIRIRMTGIRYYEKTALLEQKEILLKLRNRDLKLITFADDLSTELLSSPFEIKKFFKGTAIYGGGWGTNSPYNINRFDSFLTLLEEKVYFFISVPRQQYVSLIQNALEEHYNCDSEVMLAYRTNNYLLVKFVKKEESDTI